jgi:hypothetical protein
MGKKCTRTSNSDNYINLYVPSIHLAGYEAYRAFDNSNLFYASNNNAARPPVYVTVQFPNPKVVKRYGIQGKTTVSGAIMQAPRIWNFEGSNDGISWTVLDSKPFQYTLDDNVMHYFELSNTNSYTFYRIYIYNEMRVGIDQISMQGDSPNGIISSQIILRGAGITDVVIDVPEEINVWSQVSIQAALPGNQINGSAKLILRTNHTQAGAYTLFSDPD